MRADGASKADGPTADQIIETNRDIGISCKHRCLVGLSQFVRLGQRVHNNQRIGVGVDRREFAGFDRLGCRWDSVKVSRLRCGRSTTEINADRADSATTCEEERKKRCKPNEFHRDYLISGRFRGAMLAPKSIISPLQC